MSDILEEIVNEMRRLQKIQFGEDTVATEQPILTLEQQASAVVLNKKIDALARRFEGEQCS